MGLSIGGWQGKVQHTLERVFSESPVLPWEAACPPTTELQGKEEGGETFGVIDLHGLSPLMDSPDPKGQIVLSISELYKVCTTVYVLNLKYGLRKKKTRNTSKD